MRRGYTARQYADLVGKIRSRIPGVSMATDVIVGYPGETDAHFADTLALLEELAIDVVHVAAYSPRPGTLAARMPDDVPREAKRERLHAIERLQARVSAAFNARYDGETVEVLIEGRKGESWYGRTRTNKLVHVPAGRDLTGQIVPISITRASAWSLTGELAGPA
jgi:tRNA-2-methylthio-N6-dimethylallyladenosine synthase